MRSVLRAFSFIAIDTQRPGSERAAWVASAAAQNKKPPIVMDRMSLSRTKVHLQQKQNLIGEKIGAAHCGLVYARTLHSQIPHSVLPRADEVIQ